MKTTKIQLRSLIRESLLKEEGNPSIETIGHLRDAIAAAQGKKRATQGKNALKDLGKGFLADLIPGGSTMLSIHDLVKATYAMDDSKRTGTALDALDVDDDVSAIVDDPIENAFVDALVKKIEGMDDDVRITSLNMTNLLSKYIKKEFNTRTVTGFTEGKLLRGYIRELLEAENKGLWANVHAKKKRGEKPAKSGDEDYPSEKSWKAAQETDEPDAESLKEIIKAVLDEAEYQGRKVTLNKPTAVRKGEPGHGKKQEKVYVKDGPDEDDVKVVRFGDPNSRIRKSNPKAKKSFRARHNCDNPGPKTKARYWSCKAW